ncbi:hypothetical protein PENSPDRAFT_590281, partial [Peniophora sp. CONT]
EETLIDFCELEGSHTGEHMAAVVWRAMKRLGLTGRVIAVVMDNASNNDTLMEHLEHLHQAEFLDFNSAWARLRCMPHTVHLAALKVRSICALHLRFRVSRLPSYSRVSVRSRRLRLRRLPESVLQPRIRRSSRSLPSLRAMTYSPALSMRKNHRQTVLMCSLRC